MLSEVNVSLYSKNEKLKLNIFLNIVIVIVIFALVCEILFAANFSGIYVVGTSMNPTLIGAEDESSIDGDYVYVNKHAKPTYGDIVVVLRNNDTTIIKRVIALEGDYVMLKEGKLSIKYSGTDKFVEVEEPYVHPDNNTPSLPKNTFHADGEGYYIAEGCFFLLGDNRDASEDSRARGSFKVSQMYGVVTKWSLNGKSFFTALHKYFYFDLPSHFGLRKN